jgi:uncharacterized cupin superfamily protein
VVVTVRPMTKTNIKDVPVEQRRSPGGKFELMRQHVSLALGGVKDQGPWGGGHPFDVELVTLPAGKRNYPLHSHAAQWEHYIILAGCGVMHTDDGKSVPVGAGDHVICPPGDAHQMENTGEEPLVYYVIADHHPADVTTYPNTGKRQLKPEYRIVKTVDADYYEGEE